MSKKLDQIRKLIATATDAPESPEGKTARSIADKKLRELGMTDADVMLECRTMLKKNRGVWDSALLDVVSRSYNVELVHRVDEEKGSDELMVRGISHTLDQVEYRFSALRAWLLEKSGHYHQWIQPFLPSNQTQSVLDIYLNHAVIALSERLLEEDKEDKEVEERNEDHQEELPQEEPSPEEDLLDKLLDAAASTAHHELARSMDPAMHGYLAGLQAPLTDVLTQKAIEEAKRLISRAGLISEDKTRDFDEDMNTWKDLF